MGIDTDGPIGFRPRLGGGQRPRPSRPMVSTKEQYADPLAAPGARLQASRAKSKPLRAASIEDLEDDGLDVKSDPWDWSSIVGGILTLILTLVAAGSVLWFPDEQFAEGMVAVVVAGLAMWHFRPTWRSQVGIGALVVTLAVCARFGFYAQTHATRRIDSRQADEIRELRRGEAHLGERLKKSGGL